MESNSKEIGINTGKDPITGRFLPGNKLTPIDKVGRPAGSLDFKTKWFRMVDKLAENAGKTPEEIEEQLMMVGFIKASEGDYSFYRDAMDRIYGKPSAPVEDAPTKTVNNIINVKEIKQRFN